MNGKFFAKSVRLYLIYVVTYLITVCFFMSLLIGDNRSLVYNVDCLDQYYPVFLYCFRWMKNLLNGEIQLFDLSIGYGSDVIGTLNYYGFGDPIIMMLSIFPVSLAPILFKFMIFFKLFLAGLFMLKYARTTITNEFLIVSAAIMYIWMPYSLIEGIRMPGFLNPIMTFPLIIYGAKQILYYDKKFSGWLIGGLAYQAFNGFYFLYMECIALIIYYLIVCIYNKYSLKQKILIFLFHGFCGVGISGPILFPALYFLFYSSRGMSWQFQALYNIDHYKELMENLFIPMPLKNVWLYPLLSFGLLICPIKQKRFGMVMLCSAIVFPFFGWAMNGFSYPSDRWFFIAYFFVILLVTYSFEKMFKLSRKCFNIILVVLIVSFILMICVYSNFRIFLVRGIFNLFLTFFSVWILYKGNCKQYFFMSVISVCAMIAICLLPTNVYGDNFAANFLTMDDLNTYFNMEMAKSEMIEWNRQESKGGSKGENIALNEQRTDYYYSIINKNVFEFYDEMKISPGISTRWCLSGLDDRKRIRSVLSVGNDKNTLPFGFTYEYYLSSNFFKHIKPVDKQEVMIDNCIIEDDKEIGTEREYNLAREVNSYSYNNSMSDNELNVRVLINDLDINNGEIYIYIEGLRHRKGTSNYILKLPTPFGVLNLEKSIL